MSKRRVVVTGLGVISPVGIGTQIAWEALLKGQSGITRITKFDPSAFSSQVAGEVKNFNVEDYLSAKDARRMIRLFNTAWLLALRHLKILALKLPSKTPSALAYLLALVLAV